MPETVREENIPIIYEQASLYFGTGMHTLAFYQTFLFVDVQLIFFLTFHRDKAFQYC